MAAGSYRPPSLASEGFIHMSQLHQVRGVVERYFSGQDDLVVMVVDPARVTAPVRLEPPARLSRAATAPPADPSERFPHVHGALNADAIMAVLDLGALGV